jgi:hypothetical protein
MTLIPELRTELSASIARKRRARRWRLFGLAPVVVVATTTAALAAGGVIKIGSPATDPAAITRYAPKPDTDTGVVLKDTQRVLDLRVEDGDGGPPWGLRISTTTRALGCLLPGRVVSGRIGVFGRYGAFNDDGKLHPFPKDVLAAQGCAPLDANGRLFLSVANGSAQASASRTQDCRPRVSQTMCAKGTERHLLYGVLGPNAKSVTYTTPAGPKTVPTVGPEGAYLIVLPSTGVNGGLSRAPSDPTIISIAFRDGSACDGAQLRERTCALRGLRPLPVERLTHKDVAAKVTATARHGRRFWNMTVKFRASVAIEDATAAYLVRSFPPGKTGRSATGFTRQNYKRGELVTFRFQHLNGGGEYRIVVKYGRTTEPSTLPNYAGSPTVGRFRLKIP